MKLNEVLTKIPAYKTVRIADYITDETYACVSVDVILNNGYYHRNYRECEVYKIDVTNISEIRMEIYILLNDK